MTVTRRWGAAVLTLALLTGSACSGDDDPSDGADGTEPATARTGSSVAATTATCDQGVTVDDVVAEPVPDVPSDLTVTSFDGTALRVHWFPLEGASADAPAPTILMGPGWSLGGDTSLEPEGAVLFGAASIPGLHDAGYNVLTWDPRGFGESEGQVQINAAEAEGRDVQVLLDFVAEQPEARVDTEGDPRAGMVGFSYGGGIQLVAAGIDCRVDAIVPGLAWHSLETSLYKEEIVKVGWSEFLAQAGDAAGDLDPHITSAAAAAPGGTLTAEDEAWFRDRGPGDLVERIEVPTLFVHGTVDTLFTLDEAITNHRSLVERGVPTAMAWFCGGHGACTTHEPDTAFLTEATFAWLDRYVMGDDAVEVPTGITFVDQTGQRWHLDDLDGTDDQIVAAGAGTLELTAEGGAGPITIDDAGGDLLAGLIEPFTTAPAANAVEVTVAAPDEERLVVGAPKLSITYSGTVEDGDAPTRVFAQLVDDEDGTVVGHQVTPVPVELDGETHTAEVDLEVVAHLLRPGSSLTLQIVATTVAYAQPRLGGSVTFDEIEVALPVTEHATPA